MSKSVLAWPKSKKLPSDEAASLDPTVLFDCSDTLPQTSVKLVLTMSWSMDRSS